jgi:hypothetical protein
MHMHVRYVCFMCHYKIAQIYNVFVDVLAILQEHVLQVHLVQKYLAKYRSIRHRYRVKPWPCVALNKNPLFQFASIIIIFQAYKY